MPKVSKSTATKNEMGPVTDHHAELHGYAVNFTRFAEDLDGTPLMKGLPDDRCQCPHWGYVVSGRTTFEYADHKEVYEAGEAFYTPPGHIQVSNDPGTEIVMFSPSAELRETEAVMMKNMQAGGG